MHQTNLTRIVFVLGFTAISCSEGPIKISVEDRASGNAAFVKEAIADAYPSLPPDQQKLIREGLVFVVYDKTFLSDGVLGFGPEDDPQYHCPDQTLYPKGTIKINLSPSFVRMSDLAWLIGLPEYRFRVIEVIAHEIKHVQQYMDRPACALSTAEQCLDGLCDRALLEETRIKLDYEFLAWEFGYQVVQKTISKEKTVMHYRKRPIDEITWLAYSSMYEVPVLAHKCVTKGGLNKTEKEEANAYIRFNKDNDSELEKLYPYLTPVFKRLEFCLE